MLDRSQAIVLVRGVSFGRQLKGLHDLLEAFSYERDGEAPGPERLARLLKVDDPRHLRRYFEAIKRLLKPVTHDTVPLARYSRRCRTYMVHPTTRASLREVFAQLGRRRRAVMGLNPAKGRTTSTTSAETRLQQRYKDIFWETPISPLEQPCELDLQLADKF